MSQFHLIDGTGTSTTLVADKTAMLNSLTVGGLITTLELHDCSAVGDVAATNLVFKMTADFSQASMQYVFEGTMFLKGLVVKATTGNGADTYQVNVEWE